jgi:hypothetical protein
VGIVLILLMTGIQVYTGLTNWLLMKSIDYPEEVAVISVSTTRSCKVVDLIQMLC